MNPLLEVRGLPVDLPTAAGWVRPVNQVSLRIGEGECVGLVGESGSGKTMLSLASMGLLPVGARVSGEVLLGGAKREEQAPPLQRERRNRLPEGLRRKILLGLVRRSGGGRATARLR